MKRTFILIIFLLLLVGCSLFSDKNSDALIFKNEYESLNGKVSNTSKAYLEVLIDEDNPVVYTDASKLEKLLNDKKSGVVYFGYPDCPWCRNALPVLLDVLKDEGIEILYYQNLKDERDQMTIDEKGEIKIIKEGSENYKKLLKIFDNILPEYTFERDGKKYSFNEKRIYVPIVIFIKNGEIMGSHTDTVPSQIDPYVPLNKEQKEELYNIYKKFVGKMTLCETERGC